MTKVITMNEKLKPVAMDEFYSQVAAMVDPASMPGAMPMPEMEDMDEEEEKKKAMMANIAGMGMPDMMPGGY